MSQATPKPLTPGFLERPSVHETIDDWAAALAMSRRGFTRLFRSTRLSRSWKVALRDAGAWFRPSRCASRMKVSPRAAPDYRGRMRSHAGCASVACTCGLS
jgi:hypothetical protein